MSTVAQSKGSSLEEEALQRATRRNILLTVPALVVLFLAASGPLLVMLVFSFLTPGDGKDAAWMQGAGLAEVSATGQARQDAKDFARRT